MLVLVCLRRRYGECLRCRRASSNSCKRKSHKRGRSHRPKTRGCVWIPEDRGNDVPTDSFDRSVRCCRAGRAPSIVWRGGGPFHKYLIYRNEYRKTLRDSQCARAGRRELSELPSIAGGPGRRDEEDDENGEKDDADPRKAGELRQVHPKMVTVSID